MNEEATAQVMKNNGRSFYLASLFFPKKFFHRVENLYTLCRWIDDAADEAPTLDDSKRELDRIVKDLQSPQPQLVPNQMYRSWAMKPEYIEDLIQGVRDDLEVVRVQDQTELIQYCYKVAGAVGLAMNDLMEVRNVRARAFAVDLGIAMQLTNICRDIKEDALRDRIYIPQTLLQQFGVSQKQLLSQEVPTEKISAITKELLKLADTYYLSAENAFPSIPFRMRGAVIVATNLYRGIGHKLRRQGANPLEGRTYLKTHEKIPHILKGLFLWSVSGWKSQNLDHQKQLHTPLKSWKNLRAFPS